MSEIDRQQAQGKEVAFRGDAAFAKPELYESVEQRAAKYAIRLLANDNLERKVAQLLSRPVGRPSYKPVVRYKSFLYQAASWTRWKSTLNLPLNESSKGCSCLSPTAAPPPHRPNPIQTRVHQGFCDIIANCYFTEKMEIRD